MAAINLQLVVDRGNAQVDVTNMVTEITGAIQSAARPINASITQLDTSVRNLGTAIQDSAGRFVGFAGEMTKAVTLLAETFNTLIGNIGKIPAGMQQATAAGVQMAQQMQNALRGSIAGGLPSFVTPGFEPTGKTVSTYGSSGDLTRLIQQYALGGNLANVTYGRNDTGQMVLLKTQIQTAAEEAERRGVEMRSRAYEWANRFAEVDRTGRGSREMSQISQGIDQNFSSSLAEQQKQAFQAAMEQKRSDIASFVERAFGHAAQFHDIDRQGSRAGQMADISQMIDQNFSGSIAKQQEQALSAVMEQKKADISAFVQRAFGHAANFASQDQMAAINAGVSADDARVRLGLSQSGYQSSFGSSANAYVQRAFGHAANFASQDQMAAINAGVSADDARVRLGLSQSGYQSSFGSSANAYVERAFGHAAQLDDVYRQGNRPGEMSQLSQQIQSNAAARQTQANLASQQKLYDQLERAAKDRAEHEKESARQIQAMLAPLRAVHDITTKISGIWHTIGNNAIRLSALFYSVRRIGDAAASVTVDPVRDALEADEANRRFQLSIAGQVGGLGNASVFSRGLESNLSNSPLTLSEMRNATTAMARIAELSPMLSLQGTQGALNSANQFSGLIGGLSSLNPGVTPDAIIHSIEQTLQGNPRNLRLTMHIDPDDLAAIAGRKNARELAGNPSLIFEALQKYVAANVTPGAVDARSNLLSVQVQKLNDDFTIIGERISQTGGLFDEVTSRIRHGAEQLLAYVNSSQFEARAQAIGQNLSKIFDNLTDGLLNLLKSASGADSIDKTPDSIAAAVEKLSVRLASWSKELPAIADVVGQALRSVAGYLIDFASAIGAIKGDSLSREQRPRAVADAMLNAGYGFPDVYLQEHPGQLARGRGILGGGESEIPIPAPQTAELGASLQGAQRARAQKVLDIIRGMSDSELTNPSLMRLALRSSFPDYDQSGLAGTGFGGASELNQHLKSYASENYATTAFGQRFSDLKSTLRRIGPEIENKDDLLLNNAQGQLDFLSGLPGGISGASLRVGGDLQKDIQGDAYKVWSRFMGDPLGHPNAPDQFSGLMAISDQVGQKAREVANQLPAILEHSMAELGVALSQNLKNASPSYAAAILDQIVGGNLGIQQRVGSIYGLSPAERASTMGLSAIPLQFQSGILDARLKAKMEVIGLNPSLSGPDTLVGPGVYGLQAQAVRQGIAGQQGVQRQALQTIRTEGTSAQQMEEAQKAYAAATDSIAKMTAELAKLQVQASEALGAMIKFGEESQKSISGGLGNALDTIITRSGKVDAAFRQMAQNILHSFTQMISNLLVNGLFNSLAQAITPGSAGQPGAAQYGGGLGGIFGTIMNSAIRGAAGGLIGGATGGGAGAPPPGGWTIPAVWASNGAADGGIFPGGIRLFGSGGVVKGGRGQMGIIGEGGSDEAVIPLMGGRLPIGFDGNGFVAHLPGGRSIPAAMFANGGIARGGIAFSGAAGVYSTPPGAMDGGHAMSGGGGHTIEKHFIVVPSEEEAFMRGMVRHKDTLIKISAEGARSGGITRRYLSRP